MKVAVVYNPVCGLRTFPKKLSYVVSKLQEAGFDEIDVFPSKAPKEVTNIVIDVSSKNYDLLIVSGGDGTLNEAINGLVKCPKQPRFAYIPSGTTNDVGSTLGIGKNIRKALNVALHGENVLMDVTKMEDHYFTYVGAAGKFTSVSYIVPPRIKKRWGKIAYLAEGLKQLPDSDEFKLDLKITLDDGRVIEGKYFLFLLLNAQHVGGVPIQRKMKAKMNDGIIDLTLLEKKKTDLLTTAKFFIFGDYCKRGAVTYRGSRFKIQSSKPIALNVDGELYEEREEIDVEVVNKAINIMVSKRTKERYF